MTEVSEYAHAHEDVPWPTPFNRENVCLTTKVECTLETVPGEGPHSVLLKRFIGKA